MESGPKNLGHYLQNINLNRIDLFETVYFSGIYENNTNFLALTDTRICIAIPPEHHLYTKETLTPEDLVGETVIIPWAKETPSSVFNRAKRTLLNRVPSISLMDTNLYDQQVVSSAKLHNTPVVIADVWSDIFFQFKIFYFEWDITAPYGIVYSLTPTREVEQFVKDVETIWKKRTVMI